MTIIIPSAAVSPPEYDYDKYDKILSEGPGFMYRSDIAEELGLEFKPWMIWMTLLPK